MAETAERKKSKPGWRTTEFLTALGAMIGPHLVDALPPTWKATLTTVAGIAYGVLRMLTKRGES